MIKDLSNIFNEFLEQNNEFSDIIVADKDGQTIFKTEKNPIIPINEETVKKVIEQWINHQNSCDILGVRYVILKSDPFQFCALNVTSGKSICGSITKSGKYCLAFLRQGKETGNSLIVSSVLLNKWVWSLI